MKRTLSRLGFGCVALVTLACSAAGQTPPRPQMPQPSVEELLAEFVRYEEAAATPVRPLPPGPRLLHVIMAAPQYPPATVTGVLDGLENLALTSPHPGVRVAAVSWLSTAGEVGSPNSARLRDPGVAIRLARILDRSDHGFLRQLILYRMPEQANREEALRVLIAVAQLNTRYDRLEDLPDAYVAVQSLSRMGPEGVAALRQLRASGAVRNPDARGLLEHLEARGYRPN